MYRHKSLIIDIRMYKHYCLHYALKMFIYLYNFENQLTTYYEKRII